MIVFEFVAIVTALILETITLQTGNVKAITGWLTMDKTKRLFRFRLFSAFLLWLGSILYIVFAISWCFSSSLPIQVPGLVLITLSGVSVIGFRVIGKEKPLWFIQMDSTLSMACVLLVGLARIRGF